MLIMALERHGLQEADQSSYTHVFILGLSMKSKVLVSTKALESLSR